MIQEWVWDYPRPPLAEPTTKRIRVEFAGVLVADTRRAIRVLETSHPPVYYIPRADVRSELLTPSLRQTFCEFKGLASYWTMSVREKLAVDAVWSYEQPSPRYEAIRNHLAFYEPGRCVFRGRRTSPSSARQVLRGLGDL